MTRCCSVVAVNILSNDRLTVSRCPECGTLWGVHEADLQGRFWDESYIPDDFALALRTRRITQASSVLAMLRHARTTEPVLDYGTGQGALLSTLIAEGVEAFGCDLDVHAPMSLAPQDRLIQLAGPWQIPVGAWGTIIMLDVLEHHPDPCALLSDLVADYLVLKVPTATGPAARVARIATRLRHPSLLEQLFLVGENFPHQWLATRQGLARLTQRSGWELVDRQSLVEVGRELPDRMRSAPSHQMLRWALTVVGVAVGAVGKVWSDTEVAIYRRSGNRTIRPS